MAKAKRKQLSRLRARTASGDTALVRKLWLCGTQTPLLRSFCRMLSEISTPGKLSPPDIQAVVGIIIVEAESTSRLSDLARFHRGEQLSSALSTAVETCGRQWNVQPAVSLLILLRQANEAPAAKSQLVLSRLLGARDYKSRAGKEGCKTSSDIGVVIASFVRVLQDTKPSTAVPGFHGSISEEKTEHVKAVNTLLGKTLKSGHIHQTRKEKRKERLASAANPTTVSSIARGVGRACTLHVPKPFRDESHEASALLLASDESIEKSADSQHLREVCSKADNRALRNPIQPNKPVCQEEAEVTDSMSPQMPLTGKRDHNTGGETSSLGGKPDVGAIQTVASGREDVTQCLSPISPRDGGSDASRSGAGAVPTLNLLRPLKNALCFMEEGGKSTDTRDAAPSPCPTRSGQEHCRDPVGESGCDVKGSSRSTSDNGWGSISHCAGETVARPNESLGGVDATAGLARGDTEIGERACGAAGGGVVAGSGAFRSGNDQSGSGQGGVSAARRQENVDIDTPSAGYCGESGSGGAAANGELARPVDLNRVGVVSTTPSPNVDTPLHQAVPILRPPPGLFPIPPAMYPSSARVDPTPGLAPPRQKDVRLTARPCPQPLGAAAQLGPGLSPRFITPPSGHTPQPHISPAQPFALQPGLPRHQSPSVFTPSPGFRPLRALAPQGIFGPSPVARSPGFGRNPPALRPPPGFEPHPGVIPAPTHAPAPGSRRQPGVFSPLILAPPPTFGPPAGPFVPPTTTPFIGTIKNAAEGVSPMRQGRFGFLVSLARMDPLVVRKGAVMGQGASAVVSALRMQDAGLQREVDSYTGGCGLVVKAVPQNGTESMQSMMRRELHVIRKIPSRCHTNIMDFVSYNMETLSVVMPAAVGDLKGSLQSRSLLTSMSRGQRMRMLAGAARGVHYLHSELGLTHCDLKPDNIMVTSDNVLKIADFGLTTKSWRTPAPGLTRAYAAPEVVASFRREEVEEQAIAEPALDIYPFGMMIIQMLFVQEQPRLHPEELMSHGFTPNNDGFVKACKNLHILRERYMATRDAGDYQYYDLYRQYVFLLHADYAAQRARMAELRTTLLAADKWDEPGGLQFQEEVTVILESVLNKNPLRRLGLDRLAELLGSESLWSTADAPREALAGNVGNIINDVNELLTSAAHDTSHGKWWEMRCFHLPWWRQSPDVVPIV